MEKYSIKNLLIFLSLIPLAGSLSAYENEWADTSVENTKSQFSMTGNVFTGYEFYDPSVIKQPDESGPENNKTGFQVNRVYLDFRTAILDGPWKGMNFRLTPDVSRISGESDGCQTTAKGGNNLTCSQDNDHVFILKYAYIDMPLLEGLSVRFGQQHTPVVDSQHGISLQKYWGFRYLADDGKTSTEELGMASSSDTGASLIYKHSHFGGHLLFANGEGYHRTDAEKNPLSYDSIGDLAKGSGDSYGQDVYGMFSFRPTGKEKELEISINTPFRFQNVTGIQRQEYEYVSMDLDPDNDGNLNNRASYTYLRGSPRAKQDFYYGGEADLAVRRQNWDITIGAGTLVRRDQRGTAWKVTDKIVKNPIDTTKFDQVNNTIRVEEDAMGQANYVFAHARAGKFGFVARYSEGDGKDFNGKLGVQPGKSRLKTILLADLADNSIGNLTLSQLRGLDLGRAKFRKSTYGLNYFPNSRMRVTFGLSEIRATDPATGFEQKLNFLENIPVEGKDSSGKAKSGSVADQIEGSSKFASDLGLAKGEKLFLEDIFGKTRVDRQVFIRSEFYF